MSDRQNEALELAGELIGHLESICTGINPLIEAAEILTELNADLARKILKEAIMSSYGQCDDLKAFKARLDRLKNE